MTIGARRVCATCKLEFPLTTDYFYKNGGSDNSLHSSCKPCELERGKWKGLRRLYGISKEQYYSMLLSQNGGCKICGAPEPTNKNLCVDHDHGTGNIRGLLCRKCNIALGHVNDDITILENMIEYLRESR